MCMSASRCSVRTGGVLGAVQPDGDWSAVHAGLLQTAGGARFRLGPRAAHLPSCAAGNRRLLAGGGGGLLL